MSSVTASTDRIEKTVILRAPRSRVWRAIADAAQFGAWFGVKLDGPFAAGQTVRGTITYPGYQHVTMALHIERIEPEHHFSYRWHPYAVKPEIDYSNEPTTLVAFDLADTDDGIRLTIVESGFDAVPLARRAEAFRMNDGGWAEQITNIERYVSQP
jgi:uncharacterized protein YndB with AHSA1/START domain